MPIAQRFVPGTDQRTIVPGGASTRAACFSVLAVARAIRTAIASLIQILPARTGDPCAEEDQCKMPTRPAVRAAVAEVDAMAIFQPSIGVACRLRFDVR